jgi:hypothetical protein
MNTKAKNYLILKALFVSREVKELAHAVLKDLGEAWVDVEVGAMPGNPHGTDFAAYSACIDAATKKLNDLEELLRRELRPR